MKVRTHHISLSIILLAFLNVIILTSCQDDDKGDVTPNHVDMGSEIPAFSLTGSDGSSISSASLNGQPYLISFFDTNCSDCKKALPIIQHIYDKYGEMLPVLNVPRSQTADEVQAYWDNNGLSMPFHIPTDKKLYYKFAQSGIPRTYAVDRNGKVCAVLTDNPLSEYDKLDAIAEQLLNDESTEEGKVNLSFRLKVPSMSNDRDEYYFQNEYTISHLEVFFFDSDTKKLVTKAIIEDLTQADDTYYTQYDITYILKSHRIKVGVYDIFAIANYRNVPDDIEDEDVFVDLVDSVTYKEGIESYIPVSGPVMTSRPTEMLGVDLIPWSGKNYVLSIEMERVMSKLQIGLSQEFFELKHEGIKYADVKITNYKLVNLIRRYYLFQHKDELSQLGEKPVFQLPDNFSDYTDEGEQYVVDPLFYDKTSKTEDAMKLSKYYASWFGDYNTKDFASIAATSKFGHAYVLENTSFKDSQKNGYSTGIVFKASVSPTFVYLYDYKTNTLIREYRPEYWHNIIYAYKYNFYGSIQAINAASGLSLDELKTYTDEELKLYGIKQCKFNMGVYETYYTYWIRHRVNNTLGPMGPMAYGIVRNCFYKITVVGVSGLGNSEIVPMIMRDNYPNSYVDVVVD